MHIVVGDVRCKIQGLHEDEKQHWAELYKLFVYELPNANRQYLVQLKLLCLDLIGKQIYTKEHLKDEAIRVIKNNRWHKELWDWYVEKWMRNVPDVPLQIRQQLSNLMTTKGKDTTTNLIDTKDYSFYTGHLPIVIDFCCKKRIKLTYSDQRHLNPNLPVYPFKHTLNLRKYQEAALIHAINSHVGTFSWHRGVFQIPTGGGKTEVAIALAQMYAGRTTFIVNRKELLHQTHTRFQQHFNSFIGMIGDGVTVYSGAEKVTVASAQTLWSISKNVKTTQSYSVLEQLIENTGQLIIDEAHGVAAGDADEANTLVQLASMFRKANARWALTATPDMRDDLSNALLKGVTGDVIFKISTQELIQQGFLTPPKITFTKVTSKGSYEDPLTQHELKRPSGTQWSALYDYAIVKNPWRNKAIADILTNIPTPAIVLVKRLDHVNYINHYLSSPLPFLKGTSTTAEREDAKRKLASGEYKVLCVTTIFDEGVDIPDLRAIIMAGGGKSDIKTMQRLGRGLRIAAGKRQVNIYDFMDACEAAPGWVPAKHSRDRMSLFKKEGFSIVHK